MSVDPSAIPNFGGRPEKPEQQSGQGQQQGQQGQQRATKPTGPIMPNQDLLKQLLDRMQLKYVVDKQGDLVAPWKQYRTYFMFRGEEKQRVLSMRTFYARPHSLDDKPRLLESVDEWNHTTLWPKVYTHTNDDGTVRLVGDVHMLLGAGVAFDHFVASVVSWVRAGMEFDRWLVERLGLAKDVENADEGGAAGENGEAAPGDPA
ncbi:YbjN domain-containing protein [Streptomyces triticirhizae]|uniref:YbjN domain-containing protein n=1 Tax=Streptomyces triticirhizae TaxID=2483353 RepID=A0A3M2LLP9_9ACTN|nr:YbjN domain-containing protein [Streptomyces triticirhizae]RMI37800.1 YbjN domain-containing protein [Streptomyces triticirhizae]